MTAAAAVIGAEAAALLAELHARCFEVPWSETDMAEILAMPGTLALVAGGDEPSGFVIVRAVADEAEVLSIGVLPPARGRGTGGALLLAACAMLPRAAEVFLEVESGNRAALALYRRLGFREVGRRHGYYRDASGTARDALVLRSSTPLSCRSTGTRL